MGWNWFVISGMCWNTSSTTWGLSPTPQEVWKAWRSIGKTWRSKRKAWKAKTKQQKWTACGTYCPLTLKTAQIQNEEIASKHKIISDADAQIPQMCFCKCSQKWIFHPCIRFEQTEGHEVYNVSFHQRIRLYQRKVIEMSSKKSSAQNVSVA